MKQIRILFALIVIITSFTAFASSQFKLPEGTRIASLADVGKPGSGLVKIDKFETERILSGDIHGARIVANEEPPRVASAFNGAIVKVKGDKVVAFIGDLHRFSAVIVVLVYPDGEESILGAVGVEEEATWFISFLYADLPPMFTLRGMPTLRLQVFDPYVGLFDLSSSLDFYVPEPLGINEVRAVGEPVVKILGQFDPVTRVLVNFEPVSEESLRRKEGGIGIGKYDPETGEPLFYVGDNFVTVVTGDGACDTYTYTNNPPAEDRY